MATTLEPSEHIQPAIWFTIISIVLLVIIAVLFQKMKSPSESKKLVESVEKWASKAEDFGKSAAIEGAMVANEVERDRPVTKGDLADLERRMRRERELKELEEIKRRHGL